MKNFRVLVDYSVDFRVLVDYSVDFRVLVNFSADFGVLVDYPADLYILVDYSVDFRVLVDYSVDFRRLVLPHKFPPKYAVRERKVENGCQFIFDRSSKFRKQLGPLKWTAPSAGLSVHPHA